MPFDANLVLADGTEWTKSNLDSYGTPVSLTRNDGGFVVLDLGSADIGSAISGLAIVLVFTEASGGTDQLTVIAEESEEVAFGDVSDNLHLLCEFDILAATRGLIIGSELTAALTPRTVIRRVNPVHRYIRIKASCTAADDLGIVYGLVSPYPYRVL